MSDWNHLEVLLGALLRRGLGHRRGGETDRRRGGRDGRGCQREHVVEEERHAHHVVKCPPPCTRECTPRPRPRRLSSAAVLFLCRVGLQLLLATITAGMRDAMQPTGRAATNRIFFPGEIHLF